MICNSQVLRIWLSDEEDAQCIHTLDVSETDFAVLKAEQVGRQLLNNS